MAVVGSLDRKSPPPVMDMPLPWWSRVTGLTKADVLPLDDVEGCRLFHFDDEDVKLVLTMWGLLAEVLRPLFSLSCALRVVWETEVKVVGWLVLECLCSLQSKVMSSVNAWSQI